MLTAREMESLAKATAELIRDATAPLLARIEKLETTTIRDGVDGKDGRDGADGKSVTVEDVLPQLEAKLVELVDEIPKPENGKDGASITVEDLTPLIETRAAEWELDFERRAQAILQSAIDRLPVPKDGKDGEVRVDQIAKAVEDYFEANPVPVPKDGRDGESVTVEDVMPELLQEMHKAVEAIPRPKDGKDGISVSVDDVMPALEDRLQKAIEAIPAPKDGRDGRDGKDGLDGRDGEPGKDGIDGKSVSIDDVLPELQAKVEKAISELPVPKDGRDGTSVSIDDVKATLNGMVAEWALDFEKRAQDVLQRTIDRLPKAKDGKDGRDALELEDFHLSVSDDCRTLTLALVRGETRIERSVRLHVPIYREVWKQEEQYEIGDCVTYDGSVWIALKPSKNSKPGEYNKLWRLAVKKGRNGKDFEPPKGDGQ